MIKIIPLITLIMVSWGRVGGLIPISALDVCAEFAASPCTLGVSSGHSDLSPSPKTWLTSISKLCSMWIGVCVCVPALFCAPRPWYIDHRFPMTLCNTSAIENGCESLKILEVQSNSYHQIFLKDSVWRNLLILFKTLCLIYDSST